MMKIVKPLITMSLVAILCSCNSQQGDNEINTFESAVDEMDMQEGNDDHMTTWVTYKNERFNYCLEYPSDLLSPVENSSNNDGYVFSSDNGLELTVSAFHKVGMTLEEVYQMMLKDPKYGNIGYKNLAADNFTIAGRKDAKAYQINVRQHHNDFVMLQFEYPPSKEEDYRLVMTQILEKGIECVAPSL